jgi:uncharacterized protein YegL
MSTRRLPYYFLVDVSSSAGDAGSDASRTLIGLLVDRMRQNPYHLETAHLSVIKFTGETKVVVPLVELPAFEPAGPLLVAGCNLGNGLSLLAQRIRDDIIVTTQEVKGDWSSVVVLLLMSEPTDDVTKGLDALDAIKTGRRFAFVSKAVLKTTVNRLKDSGFSVITEESSRDEAARWLDDAINIPMDFVEMSVRPPERDA